MQQRVTAMVIGNEILYGERRDSHSFFLAKLLPRYAFSLQKVLILPDGLSVLVPLIRQEARHADYLITFGGIGATHDDLTRQAIAKALHKRLVRHPEAFRNLTAFYGARMNAGHRRLAQLPAGSTLIPHPTKKYYGFRTQNVLAFAGFPELSHPLLRHYIPVLAGVGAAVMAKRSVKRTLQLAVPESKLVGLLDRAEKKFSKVSIGSYPQYGKGAKVMLRFRGEKTQVASAVAWIVGQLRRARISFLEQ